ncbi:unnamed protein product [Microthlaspi erraticum]|uniref:Uncharacterized protein n=1 Tax=Microthlaspi erraticum TaxID=1685480 RepID=A0A6D2JFH1_9BRAS|nr:unnamed protein product [Microthlaspi erraticum]
MDAIENFLLTVRNYACTNRYFLSFMVLATSCEKKPAIGVVAFSTGFYLLLLMLMAASGTSEDYGFAGGFLAASFVVALDKCNSHFYLIIPLAIVTCILGAFKGLVSHGVEDLGIGRDEEAEVEKTRVEA